MVFRYTGSMKNREEHTESDIVVARDKAEAREKLKPFQYDHVSLKRLRGWSALVNRFSANVK